MDEPRDSQMEWSQTNIVLYFLYVKSKKKDRNELIYNPEIELQMEKTIMWLLAEKWGRDKLGMIYAHNYI